MSFLSKTFRSNQLHGIIQIVLAILWTLHFAQYFYWYHFTSILFYYMYPDWALILFVGIGFVGILIGTAVYRGKKMIKTGYFQLIGLLVLGLIFDFFISGL